MKIAVLGTGMVGQSLAGKLEELGHDVSIGTRDVDASMANKTPNQAGGPSFAEWIGEHPKMKVLTFAHAAKHGEVIFNATSGAASIDALKLAGAGLDGKVLVDVTNPLDFSKGFPPTLFVKDDDSLAEQIQRAFPNTKVVKTLNTVNAYTMTAPGLLGNGDHSIFVSGNDAGAKKTVAEILGWFGWKDVVDLGDITTARGQEMYLSLWLRLIGVFGPSFNVKIVR